MPHERNAAQQVADPLIESRFDAGLVWVSRLWLLGTLFQPWAAMPRKEVFKALRKPQDTKDQLQDRTEVTINREMFMKKKPT